MGSLRVDDAAYAEGVAYLLEKSAEHRMQSTNGNMHTRHTHASETRSHFKFAFCKIQ